MSYPVRSLLKRFRYSGADGPARYGVNGEAGGNVCFQTDLQDTANVVTRFNLPPVTAAVRGVMFRDSTENGHSRSSGQTR